MRLETHRSGEMNSAVERELREQLGRLAPDQRRQVLNFARTLAATNIRGVSGQALTRFAGTIGKDDLTLIATAIEEGCEQVSPDEW
jgi:hypothetical protein